MIAAHSQIPLRANSRAIAWHYDVRRHAAFTMVELIVVLLIMSILTAVAVPTFYRTLTYHELENAARRVKQDLDQLRNTVRETSETQTMTFTGTATYTLSSDVGALDHEGSYVINLTESPFHVTGLALNFAGATAISFNAYGAASRSGTIVLSLDDKQCTITVDGGTGQVTLSDVM